MEHNLITRCCICKTIILDGIKVASGDYSVEELLGKGFHFSDGVLSRECARNFYPERTNLERGNFDYESCKQNND